MKTQTRDRLGRLKPKSQFSSVEWLLSISSTPVPVAEQASVDEADSEQPAESHILNDSTEARRLSPSAEWADPKLARSGARALDQEVTELIGSGVCWHSSHLT